MAAAKRKTLHGRVARHGGQGGGRGAASGPSVKVRVAAGTAFEGDGRSAVGASGASSDEFDYGYALTAHKAQGSQWDEVDAVRRELSPSRSTRERWLYTAITRAAERITIVR